MAKFTVKPTGPFRIYEKDTEIRIISLYRTGTHADIFEKGKKR